MKLLVSAILPVFLVIFYVYLKDTYEKEPKRLLLLNFILGAVISVIITTALYVFADNFLYAFNEPTIFEQFVKAFFIVALTEEFSKYVIVRFISQTNSHFNEPFDGIMYAVMVGMGFAATENIMYVMNGGLDVAIFRAFTAVPAHATFAIIMGYFMGKAKFSKNRFRLNLTGFLLAIVFHGAYDFFLFIDFVPGIWVGAFASLIIAIILSHKAMKSHQKASHFKPQK